MRETGSWMKFAGMWSGQSSSSYEERWKRRSHVVEELVIEGGLAGKTPQMHVLRFTTPRFLRFHSL